MKRTIALALTMIIIISAITPVALGADSASSPISLSSKTLTSDFGTIKVSETSTIEDFGLHLEKRYDYPDGSFFVSRRVEADTALFTDYVFETIELQGDSLHIRYIDETTGRWVSKTITGDSRLPFGMYYLTIDSERELIVSLPQAYQARENDAIEAMPNSTGALSIDKTDRGWDVSILSPRTAKEAFMDYFYVYSVGNVISWNTATYEQWSGFLFTGDNRWCYNGYYYTSPANYIPSGDNYYHRLPAAYISCKLVEVGLSSNAAKYMSIAMLDVMRDLQNDVGFFPTMSGSQWLLSDYYIGPGFYDTRFNTDLVRAFLQAYELYGIEEFWPVVTDYIYYFINFAIRYHENVLMDDGWNGWMVYDYRGARGGLMTHTSLNHQIAEITLLEEVYQLTGNVLVRFVSEMMFRGVQATESMWYMSDGNLQYAWYDGQPAQDMEDYPTLTYNDLYELGELYNKRLGYVPSVLRRLMSSKRQWMEANNITGYANG